MFITGADASTPGLVVPSDGGLKSLARNRCPGKRTGHDSFALDVCRINPRNGAPFPQRLASNWAMPIPIKQANQPIFDRLGHNAPKPAPASQKSSIDAEAEAIRKNWIENKLTSGK